MFQQIEFSLDAKPEDVARAITKVWDESKVVHIKRPYDGDTEGLREFYDSVLDQSGTAVHLGESATIDDRDAQRTGEKWMEIRFDPSIKNAYRHSPNAQPLHTDGSYIPSFPDAAFIYCQASASVGGATVFLDSNTLLAALKKDDPELLERLMQTTVRHARSGDEKISKIIEVDQDDVTLHWNYYCIPDTNDEFVMSLREDFHHFLQNNPTVRNGLIAVKLNPGDAVLWKDAKTLHGRNSFDPKMVSERFLWKSAVQIGS